MKINRLHPYNSQDYIIIDQDQRSISRDSIEPSQIRLEIILDISGLCPPNLNEIIKANLQKLKNEGYIFLDAKICEELLLHQNVIPKEWIEVGDSDSISPKSGSIRFDGTLMQSKNSQDKIVLSPFFCRGQWMSGTNHWQFSQGELDIYTKPDSIVNLRLYTAVIK